MAERPDYEKGIALLSAPAEGIQALSVMSNTQLGYGGVPGTDQSETITLYAPAGTVGETLSLGVTIPAPNVFDPAGEVRYIVKTAGGAALIEDKHAQTGVPQTMGFSMLSGHGSHASGSMAGWPLPAAFAEQLANARGLFCTESSGIQLFFSITGATSDHHNYRVLSVLLKVKAVS